jgi:hypothetical protein
MEDEFGNEIPGNWEIINVGSDANSTSTLVDQINVGLRQEDLNSLAENGKIATNLTVRLRSRFQGITDFQAV